MSSRSFEIHLRGPLPPGLLEEFPDLTAVEVPTETVLSGVIADQAALYGLLMQIQALGLELVEVRRAVPGRED